MVLVVVDLSSCDQTSGEEESTDDNTNDNDNTWQTIHDFIGSLAFMPNESHMVNK